MVSMRIAQGFQFAEEKWRRLRFSIKTRNTILLFDLRHLSPRAPHNNVPSRTPKDNLLPTSRPKNDLQGFAVVLHARV